MEIGKKNIRGIIAILLIALLIIGIMPRLGVEASYIPDYQYSPELGGFYITMDGVRYLVTSKPGSASNFSLFSRALTLTVSGDPEIKVRVYSPYAEAVEMAADTTGLDPTQIFVDLWMSNAITASGAVGLWYDPAVLQPSGIVGNKTATEDASVTIRDITEIPHTVVYTTESEEPDSLPEPMAEPETETEIEIEDEIETEATEETETLAATGISTLSDSTEDPDLTDDPDPTEDPVSEPVTVYLDELFYAAESPLMDSEGVSYGLVYQPWDAGRNYIALQYCVDTSTIAGESWEALPDELSSGDNRQLYITGDVFPEGLAMARLSFKLQGGASYKDITAYTFNFSELMYDYLGTQWSSGNLIYIQSGQVVNAEFPAITNANIVYFEGLPYPAPPGGPTAVNNGDETARIRVPYLETIADSEQLDVREGVLFKVYLQDGPSYLELDAACVTDYEYDDEADTVTGKKGAYFTLTLPDPGDSTYSTVKKILENGGTLHISTIYLNMESMNENDPDDPSDDTLVATPVIIPKAVEWSGQIISYAPTHETTLSLYPLFEGEDPDYDDSYDPKAAYSVTMAAEDGAGQWSQEFTLKSSALYGTYMLVIEKASHITCTKLNIEIAEPSVSGMGDAAIVSSGMDADTFLTAFYNEFYPSIDDITLFCGDIDGDGLIKQNDRAYLLDYLNDPSKWRNNPFDDPKTPDHMAYLMDLDGDGQITILDLNILMDGKNYNKSTSDYK